MPRRNSKGQFVKSGNPKPKVQGRFAGKPKKGKGKGKGKGGASKAKARRSHMAKAKQNLRSALTQLDKVKGA